MKPHRSNSKDEVPVVQGTPGRNVMLVSVHSAQFSQSHSPLEKRTDVGPDSESEADLSPAL